MSRGFFASEMIWARSSSSSSTATGLVILCTLFLKKYSGKSKDSPSTSWQREIQQAPVSAGSVSTRIAFISAVMIISGRVILSQYLHTGLKASLVVTARLLLCSSCWSTGSGCLEAKLSAGNTSRGILFTVAVAQAVTILAAPGPIDEAQGMIRFRLLCFAKAVATWHMPCSFLPWKTRSCPGFVSSASPRPTAMPCPKIVKKPSTNFVSTPSMDTY